jgi:hypothetical protein
VEAKQTEQHAHRQPATHTALSVCPTRTQQNTHLKTHTSKHTHTHTHNTRAHTHTHTHTHTPRQPPGSALGAAAGCRPVWRRRAAAGRGPKPDCAAAGARDVRAWHRVCDARRCAGGRVCRARWQRGELCHGAACCRGASAARGPLPPRPGSTRSCVCCRLRVLSACRQRTLTTHADDTPATHLPRNTPDTP